MESINVTNARKELYKLVESTNQYHRPVQITGKNASAVLISLDDWNAIEETLYLSSIPGMAESIREGMAEPLEDGVPMEALDWDV